MRSAPGHVHRVRTPCEKSAWYVHDAPWEETPFGRRVWASSIRRLGGLPLGTWGATRDRLRALVSCGCPLRRRLLYVCPAIRLDTRLDTTDMNTTKDPTSDVQVRPGVATVPDSEGGASGSGIGV